MISDKAITQSARGEECSIRIPGICTHDPAQTVWCHANGLSAGKGVGLKSFVLCGAYGCFRCHEIYDRRASTPHGMTRQDVESYFADGHFRSLVILKQKGLI